MCLFFVISSYSALNFNYATVCPVNILGHQPFHDVCVSFLNVKKILQAKKDAFFSLEKINFTQFIGYNT